MYDSFKDPNFNVDEWINNNIDYKEGGDVKHYEDAANQLLIRLQMNSRDISQATDQNIRGLVDALPQAIAKLKHISDSVNDLSSSLRLLTNSGYKFKSDNVAPDKISELTSLKVKRDRLKDASDKLQHGIKIETDLQQLQSSAAIGDLKTVCESYKNVSIASESLSSISKFDSIKNNLSSIQKTLGNRISPELNSACLRMNSETFSKYAFYSLQIGLKDLPLDSIFKTFRQQIEKERISYDCDPPLPITDWLPMCLKKCNDFLSSFSKWTVSLTTVNETETISRTSFKNRSLPSCPILPINSKIITDELLRIFEDVLSPSIDNHAKTFLATSKFDDLSTIYKMICDFSTNSIRNDNIFKGNTNRIQNQFSEALKSFLNSNLPKNIIQAHQTLPKSNTSGNLSRQQQFSSPSRSIESLSSFNTKSSNNIKSENSDSESQLKSDNYDPKMLETCITISSRALEWIRVLAKDPVNCIDYIENYMNQVIRIFTFELQNHLEQELPKFSSNKPGIPELPVPARKTASNTPSDDNNRQTMIISNLLVLYMAQVTLEKKLKTFEINARTIKNDFSSPSIQCVKDVIEQKILYVMSLKSLQLLNGLHNESEWAAQNNDQIDTEFSSLSNIVLDQSLYVKEISNSIMQMLQTLTQGTALSSDMIRKWTTKTSETVVTAYAKEIAAIPKLSKSGQEQLKTDIDYLLNLLSVMELDGGKDLPGILAVLNADESERKSVLSKSGISPAIARGIQASLSIT